MMFLPVSINITDKKILLVGGGRVALEKLNSLKRFTGNITIVTKFAGNRIRNGQYQVLYKNYESSDLEGFFLVYACTNDQEVNRKIKTDCMEREILVNVADNPQLCDFISPAIYKSDNMTVAVGSNGTDVRRSIEWRNKISAFLEDDESTK